MIFSINTLQFGGTPASPTISVGESTKDVEKHSRSTKQVEKQLKVAEFGEFFIEKIG